jgi:hypothetical protein
MPNNGGNPMQLGAVLAMALCLAGGPPAQQVPAKPATTPTLEEVLNKYEAAVGGKAAWEKLTSRHATGSFEVPEAGAAGTIVVFAKAPGKSGFLIDMPQFGTVRQGVTETGGWNQSTQSGMRDLSGDELAAAQKAADFHGPIHYRKNYTNLAVKGAAQVEAAAAWLVEGERAPGKTMRFYFDAQSGLLLRTNFEVDTPAGPSMVDVYVSDYREVDGVMTPFTIRRVTPQFSTIIKYKDVKHNVPVDDARFAKP